MFKFKFYIIFLKIYIYIKNISLYNKIKKNRNIYLNIE